MTSSISSPIYGDLRPRLFDHVLHIRVREERVLEQREQPGEWCAQLVRDGGGEACAELLVGGQVARVAEVDPDVSVRSPTSYGD